VSPTVDPRPKMREEIREVAGKLARLRGVPMRDAFVAIASTYEENLRLSLGTADEWYWRRMIECADTELASARGDDERPPPHLAPVRSLPRGDQ
jgi:hypothetical protein